MNYLVSLAAPFIACFWAIVSIFALLIRRRQPLYCRICPCCHAPAHLHESVITSLQKQRDPSSPTFSIVNDEVAPHEVNGRHRLAVRKSATMFHRVFSKSSAMRRTSTHAIPGTQSADPNVSRSRSQNVPSNRSSFTHQFPPFGFAPGAMAGVIASSVELDPARSSQHLRPDISTLGPLRPVSKRSSKNHRSSSVGTVKIGGHENELKLHDHRSSAPEITPIPRRDNLRWPRRTSKIPGQCVCTTTPARRSTDPGICPSCKPKAQGEAPASSSSPPVITASTESRESPVVIAPETPLGPASDQTKPTPPISTTSSPDKRWSWKKGKPTTPPKLPVSTEATTPKLSWRERREVRRLRDVERTKRDRHIVSQEIAMAHVVQVKQARRKSRHEEGGRNDARDSV